MQSCHLQGSGIWNEDALVLNERSQVYGVVDGATSLGGYRDESGYTGGYIAAQLLAAHAMEAADGMPLEQMVMQANAALREKMRKADQYGRQGAAVERGIRVVPRAGRLD